AYGRWLTAVLDRKGLVIGVVAVLAILSLILLPLVGSEFLPETDQGEFSIEVKLPEGTDLEHTEGTVTNIEHLVVAAGGTDVQTMYSEIGPSSSTTVEASDFFEGENTATITVVLISDRQKSTAEIMAQIRRELSDIPEMDVQVIPAQTALQLTIGQTGAPLSVEIKGDDLAELERLTQKTAAILAEDPSLSGITTSFDMGRPEVNISIDPLLSAAWNLNPDDIASQLEALLVGKEATQWETGGKLTDITLKFPHISLMEIGNIPIQVSGDQKIQLGQIARISQDTAPGQVLHRNQNRIGQIQAQIDRSRPLDQTVKSVRDKLEKIDWPAEYGYQIGGEELQRKAAFSNLKFAMLLALVLVYMVLASQFESLLHPFIILLTVPLAATGSIFLFLLLGQSFNIMSYIGMIMLAGIAVNDSIILVDAINQLRRQGKPVNVAIIEAAQKRIRPIVMTSLTTILALLPLTFGIGASAALRSPMALAVIGGLISSTLLALFFIPVVYALMEKIRPTRD
ncbi:efflux RND transporter permease subunit, partial [bacterium]|nr:efflux RND transporter permease subunit [bacterium]